MMDPQGGEGEREERGREAQESGEAPKRTMERVGVEGGKCRQGRAGGQEGRAAAGEARERERGRGEQLLLLSRCAFP